METKTPQPPSFTVSLRGYDREEVDEYIDSLAEALGQVDLAKEQNRRLHAHIDRLTARIRELEERISSDTPRTAGLAAERIAILLRTAEDTAADTVNRAEATAAQIVSEANGKLAESEEAMRAAVARGEAQARSIEAAARGEAAEIVAEAERRATARSRQIEQWAEEVVSRTRAEEARMLRDHQQRRHEMETELAALAERREEATATIRALHEMLGKALGLVPLQRLGEGGDEEASAGEDTAAGSTTTGSEADANGCRTEATTSTATGGSTTGVVGGAGDAGYRAATPPTDGTGTTPERAAAKGEEEGRRSSQAAGPYDAEAADTGETDTAVTSVKGTTPAPARGDEINTDDDTDTDDEFEAKLEAWVSDASASDRD